MIILNGGVVHLPLMKYDNLIDTMQCSFRFYSVLDCLVKIGKVYVQSDFSNVYETRKQFSKN